jgi:serine/threonine protein kinase
MANVDQPLDHIARLVYVTIDHAATNLYYEYVPVPLESMFRMDHSIRHTLVYGLLHGVRSLHSVGIAHRDLKAMNIHIGNNLRVKLLDLGSAGHGLIRTTLPVCTITHRSPEILLAEIEKVRSIRYDGKKLDMWSVGVLIAEVFTGACPFGPIASGLSPANMLSLIRSRVDVVKDRMRVLLSTRQYVSFCQCLQEDPCERPTVENMLLVFDGSGDTGMSEV